jgi:hypothetical protein
MKLDKETLQSRIKGYVNRMDNKRDVSSIPLDEEGIFIIMGGCMGIKRNPSEPAKRKFLLNNVVKGRFIDVLKYALGLKEFYDGDLSEDNMSNHGHGFIKRCDDEGAIPYIEKNEDLDYLIK